MTADSHSIVDDAIRIWQSGVDAVRGDQLIRSQVTWDGHILSVRGHKFDLTKSNRFVIVGAGKATRAMCEGLVQVLNIHPTKLISGWLNVPEDSQTLSQDFPVQVHIARPHGINEPTKQAELGANKILEMVASCSESDVVICLLSGGGSALLPAPRAGISLEDKLRVTQFLSGAGCTIQELNTVRRSLSRIKAGGLARACNAGTLITLVLSDVLGDPLEFIASGPTELNHPPDSFEAIRIIQRADPSRQFTPTSVFEILQRDVAVAPASQFSVKSKVHNIILGNNATAVHTATEAAAKLGYASDGTSSEQSDGDVRGLAKLFAGHIRDLQVKDSDSCLIHGGEPTVELPSQPNRGKGGRNQQLALCVLRELVATKSYSELSDFVFLSGGTDGEDGPTQSAGAWIDSELAREMANELPLLDSYIDRCDAFHFFEKHNRLLITGPTGTNVCDVRIVIVRGKSH